MDRGDWPQPGLAALAWRRFRAHRGGWVDAVLMRLTDAVLCFPLYLLLFALSAFLAGGQGAQNILVIVLVIVAVNWTNTARLARGQVLALKERDFVLAARAAGV